MHTESQSPACGYLFARYDRHGRFFVALFVQLALLVAFAAPRVNGQGFVSTPEAVAIELSFQHTKSGSCPMPNLGGPANPAQFAEPNDPATVTVPLSPFFEGGDRFSCPVLRFQQASVFLSHPLTLSGTLPNLDDNPAVVTLTSQASVSAIAEGRARDTDGGDQHGFVAAVAVDVDDSKTTRPVRDPACADADGYTTSTPGSKNLAAIVADCALSDLRVVAGSVKREDGKITGFRAELVSDAWFKADHGSGQVGSIQKGARYRVTLRTVYEFILAEDKIEFSKFAPSLEEGLQPEATQTISPTVAFQLRSQAEGKIVLTITNDSNGAPLTVESPPLSRTSNGPIEWTFQIEDYAVPAEGNVTMVATLLDLEGNVLATTAEIVYPIIARDFEIDHIEVVQVVQDATNSIPLVGGKAFTIRIFPKLSEEGPAVSGIPILVQVETALGSGEIDDDGSGAIVTAQPDRGNSLHSYDWHIRGSEIPATASEMTLTATLNPEQSVPETDFENNTREVTVRFEEQPPFRVKYVEVCIQLPGQGKACPIGALDGMGEMTRRLFPVADSRFEFSGHGTMVLPELPNTEAKYNALLRELEQTYGAETSASTGPAPYEQIVGLLPGSVGGEPTLGKTTNGTVGGVSAPTWEGRLGRATLVRDMTGVPFAGELTSNVTLAHEIGHNLGLRHPLNDSCYPWPRPGSSWPFPDSTIQEHGADPFAGEIKIGKPPKHPDVKQDLMSTCGSRSAWISDLHYIWLSTLGFEPTSAQPGGLGLERRKAVVSGEFAFVSGVMSADGVRGELDSVQRFTGTADPQAARPDGDYCLRFAGSGQTSLGEHCFSVSFRDVESQEKLDEAFFSRLVLLPEGTVSIALLHLGAELDSVTASASVPEVTIQQPAGGESWDAASEQTIRWTASDPDGDPVTSSVLYSRNGEDDWRSLAVGLAGGELQFDPSQIEGGPTVWFRVVANDGFHQGSATAGPLAVVQNPAIAVAGAPVDLGEAVVGRSVVGSFTITNSGSGPLAISQITSDSEQFEVIGAGGPISVRAGGSREIAVRYTASTLGPAAATITINSNAAGQSTLAVAIQATGTDGQTPRIHIADGPYGLATVYTGSSQSVAVRIENRSLVELDVEWEFTGDAGLTATAEQTEYTLDGSQSALVQVTLSPAAPGDYTGTLTVRSNDPDRAQMLVEVGGTAVAPPPQPPVPIYTAAGIVSAADFSGERFAADMWVALFGENLADTLLIPTSGLPESLGGTSVTVKDRDGVPRASKLQFVSPQRINFLIPAGTANGPAGVTVTTSDGAAAAAMIQIETVAPSLFTANASGEGPAAATWLRVAADDSRTTGFTFSTDSGEGGRVNVPIDLGEGGDQIFVSFFGTGFRKQTSVTATIGGVEVPVTGAVAQGQFDGLDQAVVGPIPPELIGSGEVDVVLTFDGVAANTVTLSFQ